MNLEIDSWGFLYSYFSSFWKIKYYEEACLCPVIFKNIQQKKSTGCPYW